MFLYEDIERFRRSLIPARLFQPAFITFSRG